MRFHVIKKLFYPHRPDQPSTREQYESNAFSISDSDTEDVSSRQLNQSLEGRFFPLVQLLLILCPELATLEHQLAELLVPYICTKLSSVLCFCLKHQTKCFGLGIVSAVTFCFDVVLKQTIHTKYALPFLLCCCLISLNTFKLHQFQMCCRRF